MQYRILFAEDEQILGALVKEALQKHGYDVLLVTNGSDVLAAYHKHRPQLCLLDIMLPGKDGYEACRQLRAIDAQVPVIFLTAKVQAGDVVEGFRAGANDYVRKPFSIEELLVRIESWLKEKYGRQEEEMADSYTIGNVTLYPNKQVLQTPGAEIALTHKETMILALLHRHRNNITGRDYLLEKVWGADTIHNSRSLDVYINRLRKYLADTPAQIVTLKGVGYRFIC
jgi:Response regulators consisting of a CheY-like receiver domain and a winged-helix DNA-binding domain